MKVDLFSNRMMCGIASIRQTLFYGNKTMAGDFLPRAIIYIYVNNSSFEQKTRIIASQTCNTVIRLYRHPAEGFYERKNTGC